MFCRVSSWAKLIFLFVLFLTPDKSVVFEEPAEIKRRAQNLRFWDFPGCFHLFFISFSSLALWWLWDVVVAVRSGSAAAQLSSNFSDFIQIIYLFNLLARVFPRIHLYVIATPDSDRSQKYVLLCICVVIFLNTACYPECGLVLCLPEKQQPNTSLMWLAGPSSTIPSVFLQRRKFL